MFTKYKAEQWELLWHCHQQGNKGCIKPATRGQACQMWRLRAQKSRNPMQQKQRLYEAFRTDTKWKCWEKHLGLCSILPIHLKTMCFLPRTISIEPKGGHKEGKRKLGKKRQVSLHNLLHCLVLIGNSWSLGVPPFSPGNEASQSSHCSF